MDGHELIFAELEKKYNIRPELEIRVGGAEGETIVKTRLASGDMSDVFIFNTGSKINDINPERNCVDLSADYGTKVDDLYRASSSVNGKLYSVPVDYSAQGGAIYYK
jgi:raffinose/stachyose/melibiose transport system substrate-binding protein